MDLLIALNSLERIDKMSKMSLKRLLLEYLINNQSRLQADFDRNLRIVQVRRCDEIDILELLISLNRKQVFEEFMHDIVQLIRMSEM